ncbi:MAG: SURF1 family protein [Hyphomicrobiales bacterium]
MSKPDKTARRRRGVFEPFVLTSVAVIILIGLGIWQLDRKIWKEQLIEMVTQRLAAPPASGLPPRDQWIRLKPEQEEYRRVTFPAEYLNEQEALVYTAGSAFRSDVSGPGYWVFTPVRLVGGSIVIVNRGFVPLDRKDPATRKDGSLTGIVDIVGVIRFPEARELFTPADEPKNNVWYVRDPKMIGEAKNWGRVSPFYVEQEEPQPPGNLPRAGRLEVKLTNNHLQYALTWFALAVVFVLCFLSWLRSRLREH